MSWLPLVRVWLWISALATMAGWLLSAIGQLNRAGYIVFFGVAVVVFLLSKRFDLGARILGTGRLRETPDPVPGDIGVRAPYLRLSYHKLIRRFMRPLPFCFAVLVVLVFMGGVLYPPSNHTALSYRTPRVLNWLAEQHWYWIHTPNYRMNNRACGIEWLSAPLFLFTKSDRGLFLLNFIPFLLLPGLIFSCFTRLGIQGRVAWYWCWLLPTGYTFLLQAASAGNDAFPTVYALAAVDFACRAWSNRRPIDLWHSLMAASLLVGAKASNLPLLLPWVILFVPLIPLLRKRPVLTFGVGLLALLVSFLPTAVLNVHYCHDWSGLNLERAGMDLKSPLVGLWGNPLLMLLHNLTPPFFPWASWWNQSALTVLPQVIVKPLTVNFEEGFQIIGELPTEDWAGIGFGITVLVMISILASLVYRARPAFVSGKAKGRLPQVVQRIVLIAPWLALGAYCLKSGMVTGARLICPYYPLLLPLLLVPSGHAELVRRRWWRVSALAVFLLAFPVLVMTPGRPLWPAQTLLGRFTAAHPGNRSLSRAHSVYTVYANRADSLAAVRDLLPSGLKTVGWLADGDDLDISLWRPFGSRRVEHFLIEDNVKSIRARKVQYIVIDQNHFPDTLLAEWMVRTGAELVASATVTLRVSTGPQKWLVVRLPETLTQK